MPKLTKLPSVKQSKCRTNVLYVRVVTRKPNTTHLTIQHFTNGRVLKIRNKMKMMNLCALVKFTVGEGMAGTGTYLLRGTKGESLAGGMTYTVGGSGHAASIVCHPVYTAVPGNFGVWFITVRLSTKIPSSIKEFYCHVGFLCHPQERKNQECLQSGSRICFLLPPQTSIFRQF